MARTKKVVEEEVEVSVTATETAEVVEEKPKKSGKPTEAHVKNGPFYPRVYTLEEHGEDFIANAKEFASNHGFEVELR